MKLDLKLKQLLSEHNYKIISKDGENQYNDNINYRYIENDIIEFTFKDHEYSHNIIRYNFSTEEFSITQKIDVSHPVCGSYTIIDDSEELWTIFIVIHGLNTKDTISYTNDDCARILFYPNDDWEGIFDTEVYDRISYVNGVYKYQIVPPNKKGHVTSDTEIESTDFVSYDELEAFMFQMESNKHLSASVEGVMNLLRDYNK